MPLSCDHDDRPTIDEPCEARRTRNAIEVLAGTAFMIRSTAGIGETVLAAEGLDPKLRQMVVLRVTKVLDLPYEPQTDGPMWRDDGLSPEEIEAAAGGGPARGVALDASLVCDAVDEISEMGTLSDATLQLMLDCFGDTTIRTLVFIIGSLHVLGLVRESGRVPMPDRADPLKPDPDENARSKFRPDLSGHQSCESATHE